MRCPLCNGLIVFDKERVEYVCALCKSSVDVLEWPYPPEYMKAVYETRVAAKAAKAVEVIRRHADEDATAATLSGKDSEVALHLAASAGIAVDVIIATHAATRRLPQRVIEELRDYASSLNNVRRVIVYDRPWDVHQSLFRIISRTFGHSTIVTGIRRANRNYFHVVERLMAEPGRYVKLINPVFEWSATEIWSYIFYHKLPVFTPYRFGVLPDASLQSLVLS
jgi:3'-phosphoadenosine 5'-phosphosulfate sulfotransferase (PAPS reductase)/FAD synthetase